MDYLIYVLRVTAVVLLDTVMLAMFFRAICSWFMAEGRLIDFLYMITEPFILPVRMLLDRFELFQSLPIDLSFFITYLLLSIISAVLM